MAIDYKVVQEKLLYYKKAVDSVQEFFTKIEEDPINDQLEFASKTIQDIGEKVEEICKTAFREDQDKENEPFFWIEYGYIPNDASRAEKEDPK